jgi:murein L,D-transpeptidase YafK
MTFLRPIALAIIFLTLLTGSAQSANQTNIAFSPSQQHDELRTILNDFIEVAITKEPIYLILVNKERQQIHVLRQNGSLEVVKEYPCATGENPGNKVKAGDACTPEGIYFITKIYKDKKITIFGNRAFHLDYPNVFDAMEGRNGDGIYIHGTNRDLEPNSSNGCITMRNQDLDELVEYMDKKVTPVVIVRDLEQVKSLTIPRLSKDSFKTAKLMLPPAEINPDNLTYDYFYILNFGTQAVIVGEFVHNRYPNARNRGHSRTYMSYSQENGWQARKRLWYATPYTILPDNPVKLLAYDPLIEEVDIPMQTRLAIMGAQQKQKELALLASLEKQTTSLSNMGRQSEKTVSDAGVLPAPAVEIIPVAPPVRDEKQTPLSPVASPKQASVITASGSREAKAVTKSQMASQVGPSPAIPSRAATEPESKTVSPSQSKKEDQFSAVPLSAVIAQATTERKAKAEKKPEQKATLEKGPETRYAPAEPDKAEIKLAEVTRQEPTAIIAARAAEPSHPMPAASGGEAAILAFVESWRQAWQTKDIETFIQSYHSTFTQGDKDLAAWRRHKENLNRIYESITVDISDIKINVTHNGATVSFHQVYKSDKYSAIGEKTLYLLQQGDDWSISRELWSRTKS